MSPSGISSMQSDSILPEYRPNLFSICRMSQLRQSPINGLHHKIYDTQLLLSQEVIHFPDWSTWKAYVTADETAVANDNLRHQYTTDQSINQPIN